MFIIQKGGSLISSASFYIFLIPPWLPVVSLLGFLNYLCRIETADFWAIPAYSFFLIVVGTGINVWCQCAYCCHIIISFSIFLTQHMKIFNHFFHMFHSFYNTYLYDYIFLTIKYPHKRKNYHTVVFPYLYSVTGKRILL